MPTMRRSTRASKATVPELAEDKDTGGKWSGASSPLSSLSTPASTVGVNNVDQRRKSRRLTRSSGSASGLRGETGVVDGDADDSVDELLTKAAQVIEEQVNGRGKRKGVSNTEDDMPTTSSSLTRKRRVTQNGKVQEEEEEEEEEENADEEQTQEQDANGGSVESTGAKWWPGKRGRPPKAISDTRRLSTPRSTRTPRTPANRRLGAVYDAESGDVELDSDASVLETPTKRPTRASRLDAGLSDLDSSYGALGDDYNGTSSDDDEEGEDPEGETKIDRLGYLQGGREYICPVVRSPYRRNQKRQYILTMDCCRFTGARDSYMLFKQHPRMRRVETTQQERDMLADNKLIPKVTRFRPIAMITARTAFREFGAMIVKNGRYVVDDYWVAARKKEAKYPEGTLVANMSVYHSVMAAHAAGVTPSSTRKARRMTPHRANSNDNGAGIGGSRPATPSARGANIGSPAMVVNSWVQIEAQQRMQRQMLGSTNQGTTGLSGALTMASALQQQQVQPIQQLISDHVDPAADADEAGISSSNKAVLGKPLFGKSRSAETAEAVFEQVVSTHRTYFADDRGFLDGLPLVHSLASAWPRTTSLSSKLKQKNTSPLIMADESPAGTEPGDDTFGPMAYASGKLVREFNASLRFWREDNGCTWVDPHTGIRQVPGNLQPTVASVGRINSSDPGWRARGGRSRVDPLVSFVEHGLGNDEMAVDPVMREKRANEVAADKDSYPLALLPGQYQDAFPVHRTRFGQTQNQAMQSYLLLWMHHWNIQQQQRQQHRLGILKAIKSSSNITSGK
ncbi:chromatin structure-remodeling complex subunit RSC7 [Coemansia sp. IMI 203386]|nr:chromatin structure-remodeling complex subunit RSC7 [Coemansia sp. IMI 203386]